LKKITITADKGRLSEEEIAQMVKDAAEFADEDKQFKERIDAKNALEGYAYNMKNTIEDEDKLGGKISAEDKTTIGDAVKEALEWLDEHSEADTEELKQKLKDVEAIANPIVTKLYQAAGGAPGGGGAAGGKGGDNYYDEDDANHDEL
jgi:heat shock protein 5